MSNHHDLDTYDFILREENKDRLNFWAGFALFLASATVVITLFV